MPSYKSRLTTYEFLLDVRSGLVYVPQLNMENYFVGQCVDPPPVEAIQNQLIEILEHGVEKLPKHE